MEGGEPSGRGASSEVPEIFDVPADDKWTHIFREFVQSDLGRFLLLRSNMAVQKDSFMPGLGEEAGELEAESRARKAWESLAASLTPLRQSYLRKDSSSSQRYRIHFRTIAYSGR